MVQLDTLPAHLADFHTQPSASVLTEAKDASSCISAPSPPLPPSFDDLPAELAIRVLSQLDVVDWIRMRGVNSAVLSIVQFLLARNSELRACSLLPANTKVDLSSDDRLAGLCRIGAWMPRLERLSLRRAPVKISLSNLIQLSWSFPALRLLDLTVEASLPLVDPDVLFALPYFSELEELRISTWKPIQHVRRGCCSCDAVAMVPQLARIRRLVIERPESFLKAMLDATASLPRLEAITFGAWQSPNFAAYLPLFISRHPRLRRVAISDALFSTQQQIRAFFTILTQLECLENVVLEQCASVDRVTPCTAELTLRRRGIIQGRITSLRFSPD